MASLLVRSYGIDPWMTYLMDNRVIVLLPTANAVGYDKRERMESGRDPNRDFPYDQGTGSCLNTISARAVMEIFSEHLFQLAVTFHAGTTVIGYGWGDTRHRFTNGSTVESPDETSQRLIGSMLAEVARNDSTQYRVGRIGDVLYPVAGGMEDWSYAAGWIDETSFNGSLTNCSATASGPYSIPPQKHIRTITLIVETSDDKSINSSASNGLANGLANGSATDPANGEYGYINQNIRLALAAVDLAKPYINITNLKYDSVKKEVSIDWQVGGCTLLNQTRVLLEEIRNNGSENRFGSWLNGSCKTMRRSNEFTYSFVVHDSVLIRVIVEAIVDQQWMNQVSPDPKVEPQSHLVNARTKDSYSFIHNGRIIKGESVVRSTPTWLHLNGSNEIQSVCSFTPSTAVADNNSTIMDDPIGIVAVDVISGKAFVRYCSSNIPRFVIRQLNSSTPLDINTESALEVSANGNTYTEIQLMNRSQIDLLRPGQQLELTTESRSRIAVCQFHMLEKAKLNEFCSRSNLASKKSIHTPLEDEEDSKMSLVLLLTLSLVALLMLIGMIAAVIYSKYGRSTMITSISNTSLVSLADIPESIEESDQEGVDFREIQIEMAPMLRNRSPSTVTFDDLHEN
eukprot:GILK01015652.1.p1 GENE.GILK01015652.1~~GILK01015652.1.p1  ORF type:complete len:673 (+),score=107.29 GILK01015652.1:144-2021(+)